MPPLAIDLAALLLSAPALATESSRLARHAPTVTRDPPSAHDLPALADGRL